MVSAVDDATPVPDLAAALAPDPRVAVVVATRNRRVLLLHTLPRHVALRSGRIPW